MLPISDLLGDDEILYLLDGLLDIEILTVCEFVKEPVLVVVGLLVVEAVIV